MSDESEIEEEFPETHGHVFLDEVALWPPPTCDEELIDQLREALGIALTFIQSDAARKLSAEWMDTESVIRHALAAYPSGAPALTAADHVLTIDEKALEAACEAYEDHENAGWKKWADYDEASKAECRRDMRAALSAFFHDKTPGGSTTPEDETPTA